MFISLEYINGGGIVIGMVGEIYDTGVTEY